MVKKETRTDFEYHSIETVTLDLGLPGAAPLLSNAVELVHKASTVDWLPGAAN